VGDTAKLQEEEKQTHENTAFSLQQSCTIPITEGKTRSRTHSLDVCVPRNIFSSLVRWVTVSQHWEIEY
jgi:hypothetical protein